jgi:L-fuculose-phosphate aldolase
MDFKFLHPREQLVSIIERIYNGEMTTLSGGNLSVIDEDGNIWITPGGVDKGSLRPIDIMKVRPDGTSEGLHKPSSEYPFHRAIYNKRPDLKGIVHAHPPALIAFSIARKVPDTRIIPQVHEVCGPIGYAPYAMTGSEKLGENIAITFSGGFNIAMLENHGVVCGGANLLEAYQRMETLDFCARTLISANILGTYQSLSEVQLEKFTLQAATLDTFHADPPSVLERKLRQEIVEIVRRACERQLMCSTEGVISARLGGDAFLITPTGADRSNLDVEDIVLIKHMKREERKFPSRSVRLHYEIYSQHPEVRSVITAQSPYAMAFSVTGIPFSSKTIPESYLMLRNVQTAKYDTLYDQPAEVAGLVSNDIPVIIIENDSVLTTGETVLQAYDRLEVLDYSSRSLLHIPHLGELQPIEEERIREIEEKFFRD